MPDSLLQVIEDLSLAQAEAMVTKTRSGDWLFAIYPNGDEVRCFMARRETWQGAAEAAMTKAILSGVDAGLQEQIKKNLSNRKICR